MPHVELDAIHWLPGWTSIDKQRFREQVAAATAAGRWVIDGNYRAVRDLVWAQADTLIWLDYPMTVVFRRVLQRTILRWWRREVLWNGNRENFLSHFVSEHSLLLWVIQTWRQHRRDYPPLLRRQKELGKRIVSFRSPAEAEAWLGRMGRESEE